MRSHIITSSRQEMASVCRNELSLSPEGLLFIHNNDHFLDYFMENWLPNLQHKFIVLNLTDIYSFWTNFNKFLDVFFSIDKSDCVKVSPEVFECMKQKSLDPFMVLSRELKKMADDGMKPVILVQDIARHPVIEESRNMELLREVLDLFVAMSKEAHQCHVFIEVSDEVVLRKVFLGARLIKSAIICSLWRNDQ